MTERMLITGGTGFIGSHLCRMATQKGFMVTSFSLNPPIKSIPGVQYIVGDLKDSGVVRRVLVGNKYEYVVNCGGYIDHRSFWNGGRVLIQSHFDGILNLVESLDRNSIIKFVQLGSSDEYGPIPGPQKENCREAPISPYSLGKLAATHFLQMLWRSENFPAVTLRLFLAYGPGQDKRRFIPQLIKGCLENRRFPVSEGNQIRDFCYVEDIVYGILKSLKIQETCGEVINLGSGNGVSIRSVIEKVQLLIGKGIPEFGKIPYRPGENMELYADIGKASRLLNWQPATSIEQGLRKTVKFFRNDLSNSSIL